ncbi:hypothetical protein [Fibrobacter sp. UWH4]|uniref:hypothetical protein n=1 Tax=Fibrobacter sp. UWH4 TaxID=1896210 RepID=UPI0009230D83|nr:hypothetical protein [Fibrobacter sp. UWH4]SHK54478.1 hypothetical protein SAMN05720762_102136 [Fibrobacter sp. UWH4]
MKNILVLILFFFVTNLLAGEWVSVSEPENTRKIDGISFYVITKADELAWFAEQVNSGKMTINAILSNDIVFEGGYFRGQLFNNYEGVFDGNGYTIWGLYCYGAGYFIDTLKYNGVVKNIFQTGKI